MANINRVFLAGNLTRDPDVRCIPSGKSVADLSLAISRRYKTATGEDKEETCFVGVVAWGKQAEIAGKYLTKGSSILVEGSLRYDQWETNGEKRNRLRVTADRIQFLDRIKRPGTSEPSEGNRTHDLPPQESELPPAESSDADNLPF